MALAERDLSCRRGTPTAPVLAGCLAAMASTPTTALAQERALDAIAVGYSIPTHAPAGDIQILSPAVVEFPAPDPFGIERFVHVRLAVVNRQDGAQWTLDVREQRLVLADGTTVVPSFSEASTRQGNDWLTLLPGERGYLDVFFPVGALTPTPISLTWLLHLGNQAVVATTVFAPPSGYGDDLRYRPSNYVGGELLWAPVWFTPLDAADASGSISTSWERTPPGADEHRVRGRRKWHGDRRYDGGPRWRRDGQRERRGRGRGWGPWADPQRQDEPTRATPAPANPGGDDGRNGREPDPKPDRTAWVEKVKRVLPDVGAPVVSGSDREQTFNPRDQLSPPRPPPRPSPR